eukprot:TRINITY_DN30_c0_g1_i1.p1 TRINITY_DN30_c0_g1~~TRINITY_DN30_c0_g1_i1.p1  ORF type:complete len:166 (-),score=54.01 TRINITY_DN30_c0_g1_i1:102-599(-)
MCIRDRYQRRVRGSAMAYEPQLRAAAQRGNVSLMTSLLKDHAKNLNLDGADGLGNTALHYSAHHGYPETLKLLLDAGANPNVQNGAGDTPLHKALVKDSVPCIELLVSNGSNPRLENKEKKTATHVARSGKAKELVKKCSTVVATPTSKVQIDRSMLADAGDVDD